MQTSEYVGVSFFMCYMQVVSTSQATEVQPGEFGSMNRFVYKIATVFFFFFFYHYFFKFPDT